MFGSEIETSEQSSFSLTKFVLVGGTVAAVLFGTGYMFGGFGDAVNSVKGLFTSDSDVDKDSREIEMQEINSLTESDNKTTETDTESNDDSNDSNSN